MEIKQLKKWLVILAIIGVIAVAGIFMLVFSGKSSSGFLGGGITLDKYTLNGGSNTATTSPKYLTTSLASTTAEITMSVSNAKHIDLNIHFKASSTASVLNWTNYFSNDDNSNKNWYPENGFTATSNILETEGATELVHSWTPGATTTPWSLKNIGVDPVASKYMKTRFWTTVAGGDLYVEGITQSSTND